MTETAQQIVEYQQGPTPTQPLTVLPMTLVQRAFDAGNLELVEKAMALQEQWEANQARKAFQGAMSAAQSEMRVISQDAANPQTKSKYASLAQLDRALRPIYSKHGLFLSFDTAEGAAEGWIRVVCFVEGHGEQRKYHLDVPADGKGAKGGDVMTKTHAMMSGVTYARRGLHKMIFNIAEGLDLDDDGNAAGRKPNTSNNDTGEVISAEQIDILRQAMIMREMPEERLIKWASKAWKGGGEIADITDIPATAFQICLDKIRVSGEPK